MTKNKIEPDYKLRLSSKRMKSGKLQVKFYASIHPENRLYGYIMVEAATTLKEVVGIIETGLGSIEKSGLGLYHHLPLTAGRDAGLIIFKVD